MKTTIFLVSLVFIIWFFIGWLSNYRFWELFYKRKRCPYCHKKTNFNDGYHMYEKNTFFPFGNYFCDKDGWNV